MGSCLQLSWRRHLLHETAQEADTHSMGIGLNGMIRHGLQRVALIEGPILADQEVITYARPVLLLDVVHRDALGADRGRDSAVVDDQMSNLA